MAQRGTCRSVLLAACAAVALLLVVVGLGGSGSSGSTTSSSSSTAVRSTSWRQLSYAALRKFRLGKGLHSGGVKAQSRNKGGASLSAPADPYAPRPEPYLVPNLVHFVFGLDPTFGHIKFGLIHYMAVLGARMFIKPDAIQWHHKYEPDADNIYWQCAKPALTLVKVEDVTEVHGKPLKMRVQHRADILRMQIMLHIGGMYLDSDVIALRSFEDLRHAPLSMGLEGTEGLCNAVMVGAPNTSFIRRWWDEYKHFNPDAWAYHSVQLPRELQRAHPQEVQVLSERSFFSPSWMQLTPMYDADDGYSYHDNYGVHLWTSADPNKRAHLAGLTIEHVWQGKGSFHRVARRMLAQAYGEGQLCPALHDQVGQQLQAAAAAEKVKEKEGKQLQGKA